jgi:uncharacterized protein YggE
MNRLLLLLIVISLFSCTNNNSYKTIILKSTGNVEVKPDEASIYLTLRCTDKNIKTAKNCLIEKVNSLNNKFAEYKILEEDILTTNVNLNKEYNWLNGSSVFIGYSASTSVNVTIRNLKDLEELYPELLINKHLSIGGLTYHHSKIDSLNQVAYIKAIENANNLADKIIKTMPEINKTITQVSNIEISKSNNNYQPEFETKELSADSEIGNTKMSVNTGNMVVQQQLYIEYKVY